VGPDDLRASGVRMNHSPLSVPIQCHSGLIDNSDPTCALGRRKCSLATSYKSICEQADRSPWWVFAAISKQTDIELGAFQNTSSQLHCTREEGGSDGKAGGNIEEAPPEVGIRVKEWERLA
jgi:hypothetical protein